LHEGRVVMTAPDTGSVAAGSAAAIVALAPFGISMTELMLGAVAMMCGALARTGFAVQGTLEAGGSVNVGKTLGALAAAVLTAPFLSGLAFAGAKVMNFESDATIGILLLGAGYGGPQVVKRFMEIGTNAVAGRFGAKVEPPAAGAVVAPVKDGTKP
jgi:hypothetical protein